MVQIPHVYNVVSFQFKNTLLTMKGNYFTRMNLMGYSKIIAGIIRGV